MHLGTLSGNILLFPPSLYLFSFAASSSTRCCSSALGGSRACHHARNFRLTLFCTWNHYVPAQFPPRL